MVIAGVTVGSMGPKRNGRKHRELAKSTMLRFDYS